MTNQGVSRAFRSRVGLPPLDANGRESVTELDDTPADGPVPTTGGETQPPGSERIGGNNAVAQAEAKDADSE